jgi:DNA-binding transcriptional MerR regulator
VWPNWLATARTCRVKEVSRLAGVSIRTLDYDEEIKLLVPH